VCHRNVINESEVEVELDPIPAPHAAFDGFVPSLALQLSGNHRLPKNAMNTIFSHIAIATRSIIDSSDPQGSMERLEILSQQCADFSKPVLRDKSLQLYFQLPIPQPVLIGSTKAFYIPLKVLLAHLLRLPEFTAFLQQSDIEFYNCSGMNAFPASNCLYLCLYADDISVTNPLGQARNKHKLLVIYLGILNIPSRHRSKIVAVFPLAIALSKSLRPDFCKNLRTLLGDFVETMKELHTQGEVFHVGNEKRRLTARLTYFLGDSLAANAFGGFKEGFSQQVLRCCRGCNLTRAEMKTSPQPWNLRSNEEHELRLAELSSLTTKTKRTLWSMRYGVTGDSVLRDIPGFSVTQNLLFDPMHDILEGIFPIQLELMLESHVATNQKYTLEELNYFITSCPALPVSDKPNAITADLHVAGKQTSSQMLALMRVLPFFFKREMVLKMITGSACVCLFASCSSSCPQSSVAPTYMTFVNASQITTSYTDYSTLTTSFPKSTSSLIIPHRLSASGHYEATCA
jgi:hypothetical protein